MRRCAEPVVAAVGRGGGRPAAPRSSGPHAAGRPGRGPGRHRGVPALGSRRPRRRGGGRRHGARRDRGHRVPRRFHRLVRDDRDDDRPARRASCPRTTRGRSTASAGAITGGFAAPVGGPTPLDGGGLAVTGRWAWGSGTRHCTAIGGGCLLTGADGRPHPRADGLVAPFVFFEPAQVELLDTWHVAGLRGTGSTDYEVHDAVVPEGRWAQIGATPPRVDGPLYRFSFFGMLALGVASVALGLARRGLDELVALAGGKVPQGSGAGAGRAGTDPGGGGRRRGDGAQRPRAGRRDRRRRVGVGAAGDPVSDEQRRSLRLAATHADVAAADGDDGLLHRRRRRGDLRGAARSSGCSATCTSRPSTPWSPPARSNRSAASASGWRPTPASSEPQSRSDHRSRPRGPIRDQKRLSVLITITPVRADL